MVAASYSDTLITKVQSDLNKLLEKELGESNTSRTLSYATFRISYLRAVSKLRPTFFEHDEDFLDKEKRVTEWEKRQRFNELKKVWIKYDKISPDKARDLGAEDQEIENDLDTIEEEIQEEWQDFAEELLDMLDDEEDDEDFGDEEDLDDLEQWRFERKQMRQDASLLKRRILERTMQRRAREEEERQRIEEEDRLRRQEELEDKAIKAAKMAMIHEAALVALSPERRDKMKVSFRSPGGSPSRQQMIKSSLGRLGMSERSLVSPSKQRMKPSIAGLGTSERNLVSPSKQQMNLSMAKDMGMSERNLVSPSKYKLKLAALEETMDFSEKSSKHKSKNHKSKSGSKKESDTKKSKKSKSASSKDEVDESEHGEPDKITKKSGKGSSKQSDTDSSDPCDDDLLKKKKKKGSKDESRSPPKAPKTPQIKRQTMGAPRPAMQLKCPSIDESAPESPSKTLFAMPTRQASVAASVSDNPFSFPSSPDRPVRRVSATSSISETPFSFPSSPERPTSRGVFASKSENSGKEKPKSVSSLRERFMHPSTPLPPSQMSLSKYKYNSTSSLPFALPLSKQRKNEEKSDKKRRQSLRSILKTLERHELISIDELKAVLIDLSELAHDDAGARKDFATGKGNNLLNQILHNHHQNEESIMEACCRVLVPIALCEDNRDALAELGIIENVLVGMLFHKTSKSVQICGCDALSSFAVNTKYQDWIVASNGIKALLKTQAKFYLDADVQTACFRCMTQIALENRETSRHLAALGVINVLMATMYMPEHEHCVKLHRAALRAIAVLGDDEANRGTIAKQDGIYLTLLAMESFPGDEELQQYACEALCSLATEHSQNCDTIFKQDGLKILSKAMKDHSMHEGVQGGALSLLTHMTEHTEVCEKFAQEDGIDRVLTAMRNFETIEIHEQGCLTLCNMSIQNENKETIRNLGGIRMIVSAMRLLRDSTFVQKSGCRALDGLATNDQSKVTIAASGGISAMLNAMKNHSSVAGVQALAITALRKLATITRNRHIMKSNNGANAVEAAMRKYPKHAHLQENGKALVKLLDPTQALMLAEPPRESKIEDFVGAEDAISSKGAGACEIDSPANSRPVFSPPESPIPTANSRLVFSPPESPIPTANSRLFFPSPESPIPTANSRADSPTPSAESRISVDAPGFRAERLIAHA
uniref:LRRK2 ARM repeat domain-containing protein n=1 Tax=Amphora coffeiformis TaxID=265554 RepID=A0A6S8IZI7_9STRA|mmetsp:Transcript_24089/g.45791  ORF Transcript_24089/g.45791 Transcript_24089/m.45791 type:complete len:1168 (+) Transcript_24089:222-3725(+)|eukprot:scaffold4240_cov163-Amphora_coffeaeformis.AAC.9